MDENNSFDKTESKLKKLFTGSTRFTLCLAMLVAAVGLIFVCTYTVEDRKDGEYLQDIHEFTEEENPESESSGEENGALEEAAPLNNADTSYKANFREVSIIMYHSVESDGGLYSLSPDLFEEHLRALKEAGYNFVSLKQVEAFVNDNGDLPEKCLAITLDDGYENNFTHVYPILKKYNAPATIYVIGHSVNHDTYTDGKPMAKHFNLATATEMDYSGLVDIQCHTYNMHQIEGRDPAPVRSGVIPLSGESYEAFKAAVFEDMERWESTFYKKIDSLSYPNGFYTEESEKALTEYGVPITLTTYPKVNIIKRGEASSLHAMGRIPVEILGTEDMMNQMLFRLKIASGKIRELKTLCRQEGYFKSK